ncbi:MAG: hypothetical protein ACPG6K_09775, partial [Pseudohongiellaceae bacterium]
EKHPEAERLLLSLDGCSFYWVGIHEHHLIALECLIVYIPRAVGKQALQKIITLPCVGLSSSMHCALRRRLLCTASVSQYSFQARFDWAGSQTGLSLKQVNQTMTIRNKGYYAALETV